MLVKAMGKTEPGGGRIPTMADIANAMQALERAQGNQDKTVSTPPPTDSAGAHLMPLSTIRREKLYVLLESQFDGIARFNKWSVLCFNLASVAFAIFMGAVLGLLYTENPTYFQAWVTLVLAAASLVATGILLAYGKTFYDQQSNDVEKIKLATKTRDALTLKEDDAI